MEGTRTARSGSEMLVMAKRSLSLASLMVAVILTRGAQASSCPDHVNQVAQGHTAVHNHVCYLFVNKELYWNKARDACWDLGGEMLTIERNGTMEFIRKVLNSRELEWDRNGVWLGARLESGTWRWANGKVMTYTDWAENQPKRFMGRTLLDCVLMRHEDGWKWHNSVCSFAKFHYNYVCQFVAPNKQGASESRVSSSQAEGGSSSQILPLIVGITASLLLMVATIFLVLFLRRRCRKQSPSQPGGAHFGNDVYPRPSFRSSHPVYQATSLLTSQAAFPSNDHLYVTPSEMMDANDLQETFLVNRHSYAFIQTRGCNCVYPPPNISPPEFDALSDIEHKQEGQLVLAADEGKTTQELARARGIAGECLHCCFPANQGDYIDMRMCGLLGNERCTRLENKRHIYSNTNHNDNDNYYESFHCK